MPDARRDRTGKPPTTPDETAGSPRGRRPGDAELLGPPGDRRRDDAVVDGDDVVDEYGEQSFPASDPPPSWSSPPGRDPEPDHDDDAAGPS